MEDKRHILDNINAYRNLIIDLPAAAAPYHPINPSKWDMIIPKDFDKTGIFDIYVYENLNEDTIRKINYAIIDYFAKKGFLINLYMIKRSTL